MSALCVPTRLARQMPRKKCLEIAADLDGHRDAVVAAVAAAQAQLSEMRVTCAKRLDRGANWCHDGAVKTVLDVETGCRFA